MRLRTLVLALVLAPTAHRAEAAFHPNPAAVRWLNESCGRGEAQSASEELRREGRPALKTLIRAFTDGPSAAEVNVFVAEAGRQYDEFHDAVTAGRTYGLSARAIDVIRSLSRDEHVRQARDEYVTGYKSAGAAGLAVLALSKGIRVLRNAARDSSSPDQRLARDALERAGIPVTPP